MAKAKSLISVRAEKELKNKAQEVAADLGFSVSALIKAFLKQLIRDREVSFTLSSKMSAELERVLKVAEKDIKENKNLSPKFSSADKAVNYLKSL